MKNSRKALLLPMENRRDRFFSKPYAAAIYRMKQLVLYICRKPFYIHFTCPPSTAPPTETLTEA